MIPHRVLLLALGFALTLPAAEKPSDEVIAKMKEVQTLYQDKHYSEVLIKLDEIEALAPNLPELYNIRASVYLTPALRDFDKAQVLLDKAETLQPGALTPRFNKAELLFVKHEWAPAAAAFQKILTDFPKLPMQIRHLTIFKRLVCEVKLEQLDQAEKTLKEYFTFMDDSPAYYFSNAALAYGRKKDADAHDWLIRAAGIYKPADNNPYMDTMMEARWVPNIGLPTQEETK